jgi:glutamine synthetase
VRYLSELGQALQQQQAMGLQPRLAVRDQLAQLLSALNDGCDALDQVLAHPAGDTTEQHLRHCADTLLPRMAQLRSAVDGLEALVDDALWPLPTFAEMLFVR